MHWRAHSTDMQQRRHLEYDGGVVAAVRRELEARLEAARAAGVRHVVVDPGLGFSKTAEQNWELVAHLGDLAGLGSPVLVGASRKAFLGRLLAGADDAPRPVGERESAHLAVVTALAQERVWAVRVHDVLAARDAIAVVQALERVR
jgi:dihydropteroate synthase